MESQEGYLSIGQKQGWYLFTITSAIFLIFSSITLANFTYNPIGVAISASIGFEIFAFSLFLYTKLKKIEYSSPQPNFILSGMFLYLALMSACIAYYYDPTNHGNTTNNLCIFLILPNLLHQKRNILPYVGAFISICTLGFVFYLHYIEWTANSFIYAFISACFFTIIGVLPKSQKNLNNFILIISVNFGLSMATLIIFAFLKVYPLGNETFLIFIGIFAGIFMCAGGFLILFQDFRDSQMIFYVFIGIIQVFLEFIVFGFDIHEYLLYTSILVSAGLLLILVPQYIKDKYNKEN